MPSSSKKHKPRAVFDYVATSEVVWHDPTTKLRLAPGAVQNWPTRDAERWIAENIMRIKKERRTNPVTDGSLS